MKHRKLKDDPKDHVTPKKASKDFKIPTHKNPNKFVLTFMPWRENAPVALPFGEGGWDDWKKNNKEKYPIRYFLFKTLPRKIELTFYHRIRNPLSNLKWAIIHRFHPKHQYNILKPRSLKPGYYDSDTRILHACMDEVSVFVEHEEKYGMTDWNGTKQHKHAWSEMKVIYKWWNKTRPATEEKVENLLHRWSDAFDKDGGFNKPRSPKTSKLSDKMYKLENLIDATDEEMLIRLARIRLFMWT